MSALGKHDRFLNYKFVIFGTVFGLIMGISTLGKADPGIPTASGEEVGARTMEELRAHAARIEGILETASEKVEKLAASDVERPAFVDAIRQEISLSRRWNRNLETILLDVAKARRELSEREREAAKEIGRMTAVAEEARLELIALKHVLQGRPLKAAPSRDRRSDSRKGGDKQIGVDKQMPQKPSIIEDVTEGIVGPTGDLDDARATLASMKEAQTSAVQGVDAVRVKIIDALETLASARGDLSIKKPSAGDSLSPKDITGWAASMATKLSQARKGEAGITEDPSD